MRRNDKEPLVRKYGHSGGSVIMFIGVNDIYFKHVVLSTSEDTTTLAVHLRDGLLMRAALRDASTHHFCICLKYNISTCNGISTKLISNQWSMKPEYIPSNTFSNIVLRFVIAYTVPAVVFPEAVHGAERASRPRTFVRCVQSRFGFLILVVNYF